MNIAYLLERAARNRPHAPALFHGKTLICDYAGLARRAGAIGAALQQKMNLAPGARVAIWMRNIPEYLEILFGAWYAGLTVVPINFRLHPKEAEYILEDSGAAAIFVSDDLVGGFNASRGASLVPHVFIPGTKEYAALLAEEALPHPVFQPSEAVAWIFYTSGTTGRPKGAMETHRILLTLTAGWFVDVDHLTAQDSGVYSAPFSHGAGLMCLPHMAAMARHVVPDSGGFDPAEIMALTNMHRNISMFAAPTMVTRLVEHIAAHDGDPSAFKTILYGGGPMYLRDIKRALEVMGPRFVQIFAQAECPMTITCLSREHLGDVNHPRYEQRVASVGVPRALTEVRVADLDGRTLPVGEVGDILVRGETVMAGYWNNPAGTAEAFRDGWLVTGDMGAFDEDGFLTLKDRSKDMIVSGGSNIYPREIEDVLLKHPRVREVSVVGRYNAEWGEEVVAFVVPKPNEQVDPEELDALCLDSIGRYKRPKEYRFISELPKSSVGKILKRELRDVLEKEQEPRRQSDPQS